MKMREILFRGKRIDNGEWVDGCLAAHDLICPNYPEDTSNATGDYYGQTPYVGFVEIYAETVGQFTGLTDKNGKRIFEGDIVRFAERRIGGEDASIVEQVGFDEGGFYTNRYFLNNWLRNGLYGITKLEGIEVIGNIHDNPELLGEANA